MEGGGRQNGRKQGSGVRLGYKELSRARPPHSSKMATETQKLIQDAESALHKASEVVEDTVASTKTTLRKADKEFSREAGALQNGLESVLGGKSLFWVEEPVDGRRLAGNMAGWGTFGIAVHAWHRGVQRMPVLRAREYYFGVTLLMLMTISTQRIDHTCSHFLFGPF